MSHHLAWWDKYSIYCTALCNIRTKVRVSSKPFMHILKSRSSITCQTNHLGWQEAEDEPEILNTPRLSGKLDLFGPT